MRYNFVVRNKEIEMKKEAKQYSAEEKVKIALEALKGELTLAQITSKYGVHATQINNWKKKALESMIEGFKDRRKASESVDSGGNQLTDELYKQIGQLTVERDWLKKKSELFKS
jgi:transposase